MAMKFKFLTVDKLLQTKRKKTFQIVLFIEDDPLQDDNCLSASHKLEDYYLSVTAIFYFLLYQHMMENSTVM